VSAPSIRPGASRRARSWCTASFPSIATPSAHPRGQSSELNGSKTCAHCTQAQWKLVRFVGVGSSSLVRRLPEGTLMVHRFFPLDCNAFRTPERAVVRAERFKNLCSRHASAMEVSEVCGCRLLQFGQAPPGGHSHGAPLLSSRLQRLPHTREGSRPS